MNSRDLLFYGKSLRALIQAYEPTIRKEVEEWERNKILEVVLVGETV